VPAGTFAALLAPADSAGPAGIASPTVPQQAPSAGWIATVTAELLGAASPSSNAEATASRQPVAGRQTSCLSSRALPRWYEALERWSRLSKHALPRWYELLGRSNGLGLTLPDARVAAHQGLLAR